tara:strand:+ start:209 stop:352 length:144 start_codon:yes stop_codon:yes gene_type:complete
VRRAQQSSICAKQKTGFFNAETFGIKIDRRLFFPEYKGFYWPLSTSI